MKLIEKFRTALNNLGYRLETDGFVMNPRTRAILNEKGWKFIYENPSTYHVPGLAPALPKQTIEDSNGVNIHKEGNEAIRDRFYADLEAAAAEVWLNKSPQPR